ncbi:MAG: phage holin [Oscillospiraceae bacterium]|nr:phage holin [Oscillospiraceae bacterium]
MSNISSGTIARTIVLALALINQVLAAMGKSPIPIEDETITELISTAWTVIAAIIAWWKNQSFTAAAIAGDNVMNTLKEE